LLHQITERDLELEKLFLDDPFFAAGSWSYRQKLADVTAEWLVSRADWKTFITFTYRNEVSVDQAIRDLRYFIRIANEIKFGNSYTRKVGHSYFSYAGGLERQERGVIHFHMCIDREIDFKWVHWFWELHHGYAWIEKITDVNQSIKYTMKYAVKDADLFIYLPFEV